MFVVSISKNNIKKSILTISIVLVLSLIFVLLLWLLGVVQGGRTTTGVSTAAKNETELLEFVSYCGWEVDKEPVEVRDVVIPQTFDEVYNNYNAIQLRQDFDLRAYAGQRVKRWTYIVRNYPESSPDDDFIRINLLVYDGEIIGGDVCSVKLDGFMHGIYKE